MKLNKKDLDQLMEALDNHIYETTRLVDEDHVDHDDVDMIEDEIVELKHLFERLERAYNLAKE